MTSHLEKQLEEAARHKLELDKLSEEKDGFAYKLASLSMAAHIDDLSLQCAKGKQ